MSCVEMAQSKAVVFVGEKGTGKSSLAAKLLGEAVKEEMTETTALEFKYGIKQREDKTVKLNIYEIGGGRVLANLLQSVFVGNKLEDTIIAICIDLSKPGNSMDNLNFWIAQVRAISMGVVNELGAADKENLRWVRDRLRTKFGEHEDKKQLKAMPIQVVIVGTKYDVFANTYESQQKKKLIDALRFIAHTTGSDLLFSSVRESQPSKVFLNHMTNLLFDVDAKTCETNPNNPIQICCGNDRLAKINEPDGAGRSKASLEELYQLSIEALFQKTADPVQAKAKLLEKMSEFKDEKVDRMLREKQEY